MLLSLLLFAGFAAGAAAQQAATVVFATGGTSILAADGAVRRAERGAAVAVGETVDTADGRAQLRFLDGAAISLQPGTQFRVEQFRFADQGGRAAADDRVVMRFLKGALRAVSGLIGKQQHEQYRMDTPVGTIGIRGTEYGATLGGGGLSLTTYAGLVEVCNSAGCAQAGPGQTLLVADGNTRPRPQGGSGQAPATPGSAVPDLPPAQVAPQVPTAPPQPAMPPPSPPPSTYVPQDSGRLY
ncbi:MAG: FecR domain-containing protein [Rhodocyclales bacterium]|nr:FecR domain-containing protein [Rhodocyclales bacterium]